MGLLSYDPDRRPKFDTDSRQIIRIAIDNLAHSGKPFTLAELAEFIGDEEFYAIPHVFLSALKTAVLSEKILSFRPRRWIGNQKYIFVFYKLGE